MIEVVTKRDKSIEPYNFEKVYNAVCGAYRQLNVPVPDELYDKLLFINDLEDGISVETIQDHLEKFLVSYNFEVGKAFIIYRETHKLIRDKYNTFANQVYTKLKAENVQNQNANVDEYSFGGRHGETFGLMAKKFALNNCMSKMAKRNHENNEIYIHDLDSYATGMHNCLSIPFDDLLANGFKVKQTDVRPARSINTALQLVAVIFQLQSLQQFGGVSATHLDHTLVPYFRYSLRKAYIKHWTDKYHPMTLNQVLTLEAEEIDSYYDSYKAEFEKLTGFTVEDFSLERLLSGDVTIEEDLLVAAIADTRVELNQAVEGMYHNLNTLQSRSGNQLPFTSINYGTCTSKEGQLITDAILAGSLKGVGKHHKTPIFPCGIFQYAKGVNDKPGTPNYHLKKKALKSTAKRIYPNYANVDWSGNEGYDKTDPTTYFSTMGCRTANGLDINGMKQRKDGRGNICPVTIIMPTLAMKAGRDVEKFMKLLDKKITEAKDMLLERFEYIASQSPKAAKFMYENKTMWYDDEEFKKEGIRAALKHGTLAMGQLGLNETLILLIGKNHTTDEGMELAKRIEGLFKTRCAEYKKEYSLNFGVYLTPAENLCYTAMNKFKAKYGVIEGVSDKEYFTNSIHVPVYDDVDAFRKIDIESQLTPYSSAGCITYVEFPSSISHNLEAVEAHLDYAMEHDIPYQAYNFPIDNCLDCGHSAEFNDHCPVCGSTNIEQLRRVTGYLSTDYHNFNFGKQHETEDRLKHTDKEL